MTILLIACIAVLIVLITWCRLHPFLAFLLVAILGALALGMPLPLAMQAIQKGAGDTLGALVVVIALGAMLGKLVAESGAAQQITNRLMLLVGQQHIQWAMVATGFLIGIPLFYNVGFILMIPLIYSVADKYQKPLLYIGVPMLAALSVTHGFLPPHPSPVALVKMMGADMGITLLYGLLIAIPVIMIAGPFFARTLKDIPASSLPGFVHQSIPSQQLPSVFHSLLIALLPILLIGSATLLPEILPTQSKAGNWLAVAGDPSLVLLTTLLLAVYLLGIRMGKSISNIMEVCGDAVKEIAPLLLIFAGAGALKQVFLETGVSHQLANSLQQLHLPPLVLGWLIAAIIRVCIGSATVAGLTAAGILLPLIQASGVNPNLMVLSIGAGSLFFSHVNDTGFWMFKEYFNLSVPNTIRSWSVMESIVSVGGLIGVCLLNWILY